MEEKKAFVFDTNFIIQAKALDEVIETCLTALQFMLQRFRLKSVSPSSAVK